MANEKFLWMCCACKKIKDEDGNMFGEGDNPEKYNLLIKEYRNNITHDYCFEDAEKTLRELGIDY